jgi:hypothetical protein
MRKHFYSEFLKFSIGKNSAKNGIEMTVKERDIISHFRELERFLNEIN